MHERITTKKVKKSKECNKKELKNDDNNNNNKYNINSNDYNDGKRKGKALKVYLKIFKN